MSRLNRFVSIFAMPLLLNCLAGCGGDGENYFTPWINIDKSYETMIGGGGCFYVHLEATYDWEQRIQYENSDNTDWISLNHAFGLGGLSYNIKVNVEPNFGERRTATVVFYLKGYGEQCELRIVQDRYSADDGGGSGGNGGSTEISAPSNLRASANGNTISLSWNSVSGASRYYVYYSTSSNGSWTYLGYTEGTACTTKAETAGTYYFVVTAADSYGNESSYSNTASCNLTSGGDGSGGGGSTSKPSAPSGLSAYWDGPTSYPYVVLSWSSVSNATSYLVYRSTSANGSYSKIGDSNYSSYSDNNVSIGKTYYYKVKASNSAGQSDYSNYISVTLEDTRKPGPVTYGNCTATSTSITLRWTIPKDPSYGKPTKIVLRLYDPTYKTWVDAQELSGTATSVTFSFGMWIDSDGYVKCGVIPYNDCGSGGGSAKVYDTKNKKWIN